MSARQQRHGRRRLLYQDGMIGPHWSKGWIIEDCEVSNSKCCGISLGKYYDPENDHYFTRKHVKSPTQMERDAVCRGQYHGWTKENIGSQYHPPLPHPSL